MAIFLAKAKNYLINGGLDIWQRNTSFAGITATPAYTADRFKTEAGGTGVNVTTSRQTDVPAGEGFQYSMRSLFTAGTAPLATGHVQRIEAILSKGLASKKATFSFWAKSAGLITQAFVNLYTPVSLVANTWGTRTYVDDAPVGSDVIIQLSTSWQKYIITFDVPATASLGLAASIVVSGGVVSDGLLTTGWQLEEGISSSAFEYSGSNFISEISLCQRYYEKSYALDTSVASITNTGVIAWRQVAGGQTAQTSFRAEKRVAPTVTIYNPTTGVAGSGRSAEGTNEGVSITNSGNTGFSSYSGAGSITILRYHWAADAEL